MRILAEGWSPDPEEFLHRVPEDLREDCRTRLQELLGEAEEARAAEAEAVAEPEQDDTGFGDDEMIVFELDGSGPTQTVRVPSIDMPEEAEEPEDEPQAAEPAEEEPEPVDEATIAIAIEAALDPVDDEPETSDVVEIEGAEVETAEIQATEVEEPEPKPEGLVKLTKAEAKAMFEAMDKARDASA